MIVGLDIARNMGVAVGKAGDDPLCWSVKLSGSHDYRFRDIMRLTAKLITEYRPKLIAIEDVVGRAKTPHVNVGLISCVRGVAADRGVAVQVFPIASIRKHFMGKALRVKDFPGRNHAAQTNALKASIHHRCTMLGWSCPDYDASDAAALWDFACASNGAQSAPTGELFGR